MNTNISGPVDVLADAARELESNLPDAGLGLTLAEELRAYRAVIAELVSAAHVYRRLTIGKATVESSARLDAALAKFGGA